MYKVQDFNNIMAITKEVYLPFLQNMVDNESSIFMSKIAKKELQADKGKFGARIGIGGGFGMSVEGQPTPEAHAPLYANFEFTSKDAYNDIKISEKVVRLAQKDTSTLVNAVADELEASTEASKWNTNRMLFGDGTAFLCDLTASATQDAASGTTTLTVDDITKLKEGLAVDVYTYASTSASDVNLPTSNKSVQIISIDPATNKVVLNKGDVAATTAASGVYGKLYVQNSKDRELTGLGAIFSTAGKIYGVDKSKSPLVKPFTISAQHNIDDIIVYKAIQMAEKRNGKIDLLMLGNDAFISYLSYLKESNTQYVVNNKYTSGFASYEMVYGNRKVELVNEPMMPADKIWGVDTSMFELHQVGWDYADFRGSAFTLVNGTSYYRALLSNYLELVCRHPGAQIEITDAADNA